MVHGVNADGNSVACHVHNFTAYMYIHLLDASVDLSAEKLETFRMNLNKQLRAKDAVVQIEVVQKIPVKFHQLSEQPFLKCYIINPKFVPQLKTIVEKGVYYDGRDCLSQTTYESNIPYVLRFMVDNEIGGMTWVRIAKQKWEIRHSSKKETRAQIEFDVMNYNDVECLPCDGQYSKLAPLRILSFDIECSAKKGHFPVAQKDQVIQIANIVKIQGESEIFGRNVFTLHKCAPIVGSKVISFDSETEMLIAWRDFLLEVDPDIITGYNINNFDLPYIIERAQALKMNSYPRFSRYLNRVAKMKTTTFTSTALGTRDSKEITIEGRVQFDMLTMIIRDHKLSSYSLNSVSAHFLGEKKEEIHHSIISALQAGDEFTRRRLAVYCIKDAYLPLRLMEKLMCLFNTTEMARVTGVPISFLFTRGQQIKVMSQLLRKAKDHNLVVPNEKSSSNDGKFEGAVVIEPTKGFYRDPVATLDFASLYPSIMMAHNLCYSTLVPPHKVSNYKPDEITKTPNGDTFVKPHIQKGILPLILEELIAARKRAKLELAKASDPFEKAVLDGRQLALKISANSVYGFTGAQIGQLPCLEISSSVTAFGRVMIEQTRSLVLQKYTKANGYEFDSQVIYGDTDSVMVKFGTEDITESMRLGKEAAQYVSEHFIKPIKLEFEKVYCPYLLIAKKRYAGLYWTKPEKFDKMDCKGIETVRRDNCRLVKQLVQKSLDCILIDRDPQAGIDYCRGKISDLLQNRIDLSDLIITKGLNKRLESDEKNTTGKSGYANKQAHQVLAEKMHERDASTAPNIGDRIQYVMVQKTKDSKGYEKAEDPLFVLQNHLPIDINFYLEQKVKNPLLQIFTPCIKSQSEADATKMLFSGEHMRNVYKPKVSEMKKGLSMFMKVNATCLGCKVLLKDSKAVLCVNCEKQRKQIYIEYKQELKLHEKSFSDLWVQCQRCQGSLFQEVLCQNKTCEIFYLRVNAKKKVEESQA